MASEDDCEELLFLNNVGITQIVIDPFGLTFGFDGEGASLTIDDNIVEVQFDDAPKVVGNCNDKIIRAASIELMGRRVTHAKLSSVSIELVGEDFTIKSPVRVSGNESFQVFNGSGRVIIR